MDRNLQSCGLQHPFINRMIDEDQILKTLISIFATIKVKKMLQGHGLYDIVTCQAHPVLVKKANQMCGSFLFKIFYLGDYLACVLLSWRLPCRSGGRTKGSLAPCLVAARAVRWRPGLAGTRQYIAQNYSTHRETDVFFDSFTFLETLNLV